MDILHSTGELDVLPYYAKVAPHLAGFLRGLEIATKILMPNGMKLLKRGSKLEPLFIDEVASAVNDSFIHLRKLHLEEARPKITAVQDKIWQYFFPRKLMDLFYATNGEAEGKPISRVFFDIDRSNMDAAKAQHVAKLLVNEIRASNISFRSLFTMWTGSSFHVYILLKKAEPADFYDRQFQCAEKSETLAMTWVRKVASQCDFHVVGGHEKIKDAIIIDPSQTPSGKLARAPFSLHISGPKVVDGVAVPLTLDMLDDKGLVAKLKSYTPDKVIDGLKELAKRMPKP
jgi:hypothetical protein